MKTSNKVMFSSILSLFIGIVLMGVGLENLTWIFFLIAFVLFVSVFFIDSLEHSEKKRLSNENLMQIMNENELTTSQYFISSDSNYALALDENREVLVFFKKENQRFHPYITSFSKLIEIEILKDGQTLTKTSKGGIVGGALVGSLVAGGIGAIIGSMTGGSSSEQEYQTLSMKLVVEDLNNPTHIIKFLDSETPINKRDKLFKDSIQSLDHWYGIFKIILKQNNSKQNMTM